jgi:hypothetical protein
MYKECIIENVDMKKEEAKKAILAKFAMDEETAELAVNSAPLELLNDLDKFIQVLENFLIDRQTALLLRMQRV